MYDKHDERLNDESKDEIWLEITEQLGYDEDVASVYLQSYVGTQKELDKQLAIASKLGFRGNFPGLVH